MEGRAGAGTGEDGASNTWRGRWHTKHTLLSDSRMPGGTDDTEQQEAFSSLAQTGCGLRGAARRAAEERILRSGGDPQTARRRTERRAGEEHAKGAIHVRVWAESHIPATDGVGSGGTVLLGAELAEPVDDDAKKDLKQNSRSAPRGPGGSRTAPNAAHARGRAEHDASRSAAATADRRGGRSSLSGIAHPPGAR